MDFNHLLYGLDLKCLDEQLEKIISEKDAVYLYWPSTFEKLSFENFVKLSDKKEVKTKKYSALSEFIDNKADNKIIIIKNVHALAHASDNPEQFYKNILGACNFITNQHKINFMLTCVKIPRVFVKENPFIAQWKMLQCEPELDKKDEDKIHTLQHQDIYGRQFTKQHYISLKEKFDHIKQLELSKIPKEPDYADIHRQILATIESLMEFESDIYIRDEQTKNEELPLEDIDKIKEGLEKHIFGQEEAIQRVVNVALMFYGSKKIDDKPRQTFLFVGPSGVGKTELCLQLKKILSGYQFLQINLAEHQDEHAVNKLIGIGRGYIDSESGGILTEPVRRYPKHIILFDELDQAHKSILQLFYKIFEGTIQDGRGRDVSFRDCFIFMTTNKGVITESKSPEEKRHAIELKLIEEGKESKERGGTVFFTQPFLGRINWIVQFNQLSLMNLVQIAEEYFKKRITDYYKNEYNVSITFNSEIEPKLLTQKVFNESHLFYEIWALMASKKGENEQGARRLYQYMDELLIYPLEYFRLRNKKWFKNNKSKIIELSFQPFLLNDENYNRANILLIDDEKNEVEKLKVNLSGLPVNIQYANFDEEKEIMEHAPGSAAILLDLLNENGDDIGMKILEKMKGQDISSPISIYTSMPEGSGLDQFRGDLWKYKIFQYINKNPEKKTTGERETAEESRKRIREKICNAIQSHYLNMKYDEGEDKPAVVRLKPPEINEGDEKATFLMEY